MWRVIMLTVIFSLGSISVTAQTTASQGAQAR